MILKQNQVKIGDHTTPGTVIVMERQSKKQRARDRMGEGEILERKNHLVYIASFQLPVRKKNILPRVGYFSLK